jgi:hypothetical protein
MAEKHSMKMGGEKPMPTPEQQNKLEVVKLDHHLDPAEYKKYMSHIRRLTRNALDTTEGVDYSEREDDVTDLGHKYLKNSEHGELYVGVKNDVVVAFIALKKKTEGSHKTAVVDQIRYASGLHSPETIVGGVLAHVKSTLESAGIHDADIESNGEHHKLSKVEGTSWFQKLFEIKDSNEDHERSDLDAHV